MTMTPIHPLDLLPEVAAGREAVYQLADLAPHRCIPLADLALQLTHLEILLGRPGTLPTLVQRSVAENTGAALSALDDLARSEPLTATPLFTQVRCCRALFVHLAERALHLPVPATY